MWEFKSDILETDIKWFKDSASKNDLIRLDELINARVSKGWTFVTHSYMTNIFSFRSAILITFKREK